MPRDLHIDQPAVRNNVRAVVDGSEWNQRGWTFQERLLSTRCIVITEHEVYFMCSEQASPGDLGLIPSYGAKTSFGTTDFRAAAPHIHDDGYTEYRKIVEQYTMRQLSFPSDIFNAFAGVSNVLSVKLRTSMLQGLPEKHIAAALLWGPAKGSMLTRREGTHATPSWSWAAWSGPVQYDVALGNYDWFEDDSQAKSNSTISLVHFYTVDAVLGLRALEADDSFLRCLDLGLTTILTADEAAIREYRTFAHYWPLENLRVWQSCPHGLWDIRTPVELDPSIVVMAEKHRDSLVCKTTVASVRLRRAEQWKDRVVVDMCDRELKGIGRLMKMYDGQDHWIDFNQAYDAVVIYAAVMPPRSQRGPMRDSDLWDERVRQHGTPRSQVFADG
ncbi:hypothetical protein LTR85_003338 [Meristemomyces frigidus]|nr:hypothetical protein LTR85_003338 [Meristemomyces frigidus]